MTVKRKACFLPGLAGLLATGGCAFLAPTDPYRPVGPASRPDGAASAARTEESAAPVWAGPLSLEEAVERALAGNPGLAAAAGDARAAAARRDGAEGGLYPKLSAEGGYTRYLDDQRLVPVRANGEAGTFSDSIYSGDLVVRMPLFSGGRLVHEMRAAELVRLAAERRLGRTREELVFNVTTVFYGLLAQEQLIASLRVSQEALAGHLARVEELLRAQKAARVDRLRTEVRLADVGERLVREENTLAVQGRLLASLMGCRSGGGAPTVRGALDGGTFVAPVLEAGTAAALGRRQDYLAARRELEAQARRVDVARAALAPEVSLFGAYGGRWDAHTARVPAGGGEWEDVGRVGVGVTFPLFEGGTLRARVEEERATLSAAQARLREMELRIRLEVETALLNHGSARKRAQTLEKAVEQAEESLRIERQKYEVGKGAIVDVLDAQAALLEAQTSHTRALADVCTARAQIGFATGEGL